MDVAASRMRRQAVARATDRAAIASIQEDIMLKPYRIYRSGALGTALCAVVATTAIAPALAAIDDQSGDAAAKLAPTGDSRAAGTVTFKPAGKDGTRVTVMLSGLEPGSVHGLHVHERGDCSAPDASSAGPHFALPGQQHGSMEGIGHHAGDLGNVTADAAGNATGSLVVPSSKLTVTAGPLSVVGRAVVVHAGPDDLKSQPAGNSGARIACGVVDREADKDGQAPMKPAGS
jgi:Cu-Zn family superoxide dismutase